MVQIIPRTRPNFGEQVASGMGRGIDMGTQFAQMAMQHGMQQKSKQAELAQKLAAVQQFKNSPMYEQLTDMQKFALENEIAGLTTGGTAKSLINAEREAVGNEMFSDLTGMETASNKKPTQEWPDSNQFTESDEDLDFSPKNQKIPQTKLEAMPDSKLTALQGHPNKNIAAAAKAEAEKRRHKEDINFQKRKFAWEEAKPTVNYANELALNIPEKERTLEGMKTAFKEGNFKFLSPDNFAEMTGVEAFRTPEGALAKSSLKEYFLNDLKRAGARPNQWIEQQLADALPKMGRDRASNEIIIAGFQAKLDWENAWLDEYRKLYKEQNALPEGVSGDIGQQVAENIRPYLEERQNILKNEIENIRLQSKENDSSKNIYKKSEKVEAGTKITPDIAFEFLQKSGGNREDAERLAKEAGYEF